MSILAAGAFVITFGRVQLWYDESNYVDLAGAIDRFGFPVWFWDPEVPRLFLDSPPLVIYLTAGLRRLFGDNIFVLRLFYASLFSLIPAVALFYYVSRRRLPLIVFSVTAIFCVSSGYFTFELIQLRMDLPLSGIGFALLVFAASTGETQARPLRHFLVVAALSTIAFLTKYQAVCITFALLLNVAVERSLTSGKAGLRLFAGNLLGVAIGVLAMLGLTWLSGVGNQLSEILDNFNTNVGRVWIEGGSSFGASLTWIWWIATLVAAKIAVPVSVLLMVFGRSGKRLLNDDPLFRLSVLLIVSVALFNLAVFRMPGAGGYYMIQAAPPLGYVMGRSIAEIIETRRLRALGVILMLTLMHLTVNWQWGNPGLQRWDAGSKSLRSLSGRDFYSRAADVLKGRLQPNDILLMDGWKYQGRILPVLLRRPDHYGFLFDMTPDRAEAVIRESPVAAVALLGKESELQLHTDEWAGVRDLISRSFILLPKKETGPNWTIYVRRPTGS